MKSQVYSNHARSGLNIAGQEGLNRLMAYVEAKQTGFTSLLAYTGDTAPRPALQLNHEEQKRHRGN
jgi:hypothetical protein